MKYPQVVSMPSAVSDWLEEQLEARGIDAVVYTRYILSLLHTHTIDVICPDDDLPFSRLNKEVRRQSSGRGRKRSRGSSSFSCTSSSSSSEWWRHAHVDAERIKRSAAVECLMSVSEQNGEIETLVDELCEKLKQVKSSSSSPLILPSSTNTSFENISPQELAAKYYAAFPPLKSQSSGQQPSNWVAVDSKWKHQLTPNKTTRGTRKPYSNKSTGYEAKLFSKVDTDSVMNNHVCFKGRQSQSSTNSQRSAAKVNMSDECISDENEFDWYEDLPVDIQELLDSPCPKNESVNMLTHKKTVQQNSYIAYGANIINSIWSNEQNTISDNDINDAIASEYSVDSKYSNIDINSEPHKITNNCSNFENLSDNETYKLFDNSPRSFWPIDGFRSLSGDCKKAADAAENNEKMSFLTKSLIKLNHNSETSPFAKVIPQIKEFNPFEKSTSIFSFNCRPGLYNDSEKEDLLTSDRSHFKPIGDKLDIRPQKQYEDGSTFNISNSLDKVEYKRSESGTMWLETGLGQGKKYYEYKSDDLLDTASKPSKTDFTLKFSVCQNDKACQTEGEEETDLMICFEEITDNKNRPTDIRSEFQTNNATGYYLDQSVEELRRVCSTVSSDEYSFSPTPHCERPDSVLRELLWKNEIQDATKCKKKNTTKWNTNIWSAIYRSECDIEILNNFLSTMRRIWNDEEVSQSYLSSATGILLFHRNMELREDIRRDGEQLLADISNLQKSFIEEQFPSVAEASCNTSELLDDVTNKERKRSHSFIMEDPGSWSFASRLEEDCLIQMSTLPTIRSITL